jgi:hypothetical protein
MCTEEAQILGLLKSIDKKTALGYIFVNIFKNSSGHPGRGAVPMFFLKTHTADLPM